MRAERGEIVSVKHFGGSMLAFHIRGLRAARVVPLMLVLLSPAILSFAQNPVPAPALEPPPYQWPRSHNYDVQHYRIELSFDWTRQSVKGETTITFQPFVSDVKEIEIDAGDMTIKSVKIAGGAPLKFRYADNE